jgi:hypothetical protein
MIWMTGLGSGVVTQIGPAIRIATAIDQPDPFP